MSPMRLHIYNIQYHLCTIAVLQMALQWQQSGGLRDRLCDRLCALRSQGERLPINIQHTMTGKAAHAFDEGKQL